MSEEIEIKPLDTLLNFVRFMHFATGNFDNYINFYQETFEKFELKTPKDKVEEIMNSPEFFLKEFILYTKQTALYIELFWEEFYESSIEITNEELVKINKLLFEFYSQYFYVIKKFSNYKNDLKKDDSKKIEEVLTILLSKYDFLILRIKNYNEQFSEKIILM